MAVTARIRRVVVDDKRIDANADSLLVVVEDEEMLYTLEFTASLLAHIARDLLVRGYQVVELQYKNTANGKGMFSQPAWYTVETLPEPPRKKGKNG